MGFTLNLGFFSVILPQHMLLPSNSAKGQICFLTTGSVNVMDSKKNRTLLGCAEIAIDRGKTEVV
jgi:hypothetical protein